LDRARILEFSQKEVTKIPKPAKGGFRDQSQSMLHGHDKIEMDKTRGHTTNS